jgi:hypothetical protein
MKEIVMLSKEIQKIRKNPILILDLKEVRKSDLLRAHSLLHCKNYKKLDVILQTPGGDIDAAFAYSKLLRKSAEEINIIVPLYAKSAGTLICLIADKILMTDLSELGPLDTQIRESNEGDTPHYNSALNGFKALEQVQQHTIETLDITTKLILSRSGLKISDAIHLASEFAGHTSGTLYAQLNPIKIGEYARALEIGETYGKIILTRYSKWIEQKAESVIKTLVYQYPSHGFVIDCEELQALGLPAEIVNIETSSILFHLREILIRTKSTFIELIELEDEKTNPCENDKKDPAIKTTKRRVSKQS